MGRKPIIDKKKLPRLIKSGKTQREIAVMFGVSEASVSEAKKELGIAVGRSVTLESAHKVVGRNLDAVEQLQRINDVANNLLNELTGDDHIIDNMVQAVRAFQALKEENTKENIQAVRNIILKVNGEKNTAIKACAEIRGQLSLQLEIFQTLYDIEAVAEFQRVVLDAIAEVAPTVRKTIISNLKKRKALRESVTFRGLRSNL